MVFDCRGTRLAFVLSVCLGAAACGGDDGPSGTAPAANNPTPPPSSGGTSGGKAANSAPTISGKPLVQVVQETPYSFQPVATDPDGDPLTFKVVNLPPWASFSDKNGRLQGTPSAADIGVYPGIVITVSDGQAESALDAFDITVTSVGSGSAVLSWLPPTENEDGTPLTDLAGYKLYWGTSSGKYDGSVTIDNPGVTTYVLDNLAPATYYFVATAYNAEGAESEPSNEAVGTVL